MEDEDNGQAQQLTGQNPPPSTEGQDASTGNQAEQNQGGGKNFFQKIIGFFSSFIPSIGDIFKSITGGLGSVGDFLMEMAGNALMKPIFALARSFGGEGMADKVAAFLDTDKPAPEADPAAEKLALEKQMLQDKAATARLERQQAEKLAAGNTGAPDPTGTSTPESVGSRTARETTAEFNNSTQPPAAGHGNRPALVPSHS